jgi:hypothetical protein
LLAILKVNFKIFYFFLFDSDLIFAKISALISSNDYFTMKQMQQLILQCVTFCNTCTLGKLYEISAQVESLYPEIERISKFHEFHEFFFQSML